MANATRSKDKRKPEARKIYFKHRPGCEGEAVEFDWDKGLRIISNVARKWSDNPENFVKWFLEGDMCFTPLGAFSINPIN